MPPLNLPGDEQTGPWFEKYGNTYTYRERDFCEFYLTNPNGSWAARQAGYSPKNAKIIAGQLTGKPKIKLYLKMRREENGPSIMPLEELLDNLNKIAQGDIADIIVWADEAEEKEDGEEGDGFDQAMNYLEGRFAKIVGTKFKIDLDKARELGMTDLIKEIKHDKEGRLEVKLIPREFGLTMLARYYGILNLTSAEAERALTEKGYLSKE